MGGVDVSVFLELDYTEQIKWNRSQLKWNYEMVHGLTELSFYLYRLCQSTPRPPSPPHSSRASGRSLDHIRYHAANPASAANQVANRTCPVGCRRTAIASWQKYAVPPDAAATQSRKTTVNKVTAKDWSWFWYSYHAYPFWQRSTDTCWCLHPLLHGRACQHLKHHPGWFYRSLLTPQTPVRTNKQY